MLSALQPAPAFPTMDVAYRGPRNFEPNGDFALQLLTFEGDDFANINICQFGSTVAFAAIVGAVNQSICRILGRRFPRHVTFSDAGEMAIATGMSGLVFGCRRWAVLFGADQARYGLHATINPQCAAHLRVVLRRLVDRHVGAIDRNVICTNRDAPWACHNSESSIFVG